MDTVAVLNTVRLAAGGDYAARVPAATQGTIASVGQAVTDYIPNLNEFTNTLLEKIGLTVIETKMAGNRLSGFKKGKLSYGATVEEIFIEMAKAAAFDKDGANALARTKPDVKVYYHTENRQATYPITVSDDQVRKAFRSENGVSELLAGIINSAYSADSHDEYILMKNVLATYASGEPLTPDYYDYEVTAITDAATAGAFLRTLRKASLDMSYMSSKYNKAGVMTKCEQQNQSLIVHKDVLAHVDADVLAKSFNMGKTDIQVTIVPVDDFGTMADSYGILMDSDWFEVRDTHYSMENVRNGQGRFTNYFLHHDQILSASRFKNAIRFKVKA